MGKACRIRACARWSSSWSADSTFSAPRGNRWYTLSMRVLPWPGPAKIIHTLSLRTAGFIYLFIYEFFPQGVAERQGWGKCSCCFVNNITGNSLTSLLSARKAHMPKFPSSMLKSLFPVSQFPKKWEKSILCFFVLPSFFTECELKLFGPLWCHREHFYLPLGANTHSQVLYLCQWHIWRNSVCLCLKMFISILIMHSCFTWALKRWL